MKEKVKKIMSLVFNIDVNDIHNDASPDNIANWDSLRHMSFVLALEEELNVEFTDEQITEMMNLELVLEVLREV